MKWLCVLLLLVAGCQAGPATPAAFPFANPLKDEPKIPADYGVWVQVSWRW